MPNTKTITIGELLQELSHVRRRMSMRKGDKATVDQAMQVIAMMGQRIEALQAQLSDSVVREREAQVRSKDLVLTDA